MTDIYYAHSGDAENNILHPQKYNVHVEFVHDTAVDFIKECIAHSATLTLNQKHFVKDVVALASYWHDVGKLDENIQKHLSQTKYADEKILNHVDAGVAITLKYFHETKNTAYLVAALLIYSHHIGLPNWIDFIEETKNFKLFSGSTFKAKPKFRDTRVIDGLYDMMTKHVTVAQYIDSNVDSYIKIQKKLMGFSVKPKHDYKNIDVSALDIRIMFSCFIDADHTDTDLFYSGTVKPTNYGKLSPKKRLKKIKEYTAKLSKKSLGTVHPTRIESREKLFDLSLNYKELSGMINYEAPVGTGKTTSCMALALRMAIKNKCDRMYTILPYTNVISQTVETYRKCLLSKGENPHNINEIHSKTEFEDARQRKYSKQWKYPINVSTAVQYYESLVANNTSSIRKIHWFSNSVTILDEYDKSIPHTHWSYILPLLNELHTKYNCHFIKSSGTPIDYFKIHNIPATNKREILSHGEWNYYQTLESDRVNTVCIDNAFSDLDVFYDFIFEKIGNKNSGLIVLNTIVNAIQVFDFIKNKTHDYEVYHISSTLTTVDKEAILDKVKAKLNKKKKIILVATSIIECGVDISFDVGFREKTGLLSVLQCNGRINRNSLNTLGENHVFTFSDELANNRDGIFTENPQLRKAIEIFDYIKLNDEISPSYCQESVRLEIDGVEDKSVLVKFNQWEQDKAFRSIAEEFKVIDSYTVIILVNKDTADKIKNGNYVSSSEINRNSIQLWSGKYDKIKESFDCIEEIVSEYGQTYLTWTGYYDPEYYGIGQTLVELRNY